MNLQELTELPILGSTLSVLFQMVLRSVGSISVGVTIVLNASIYLQIVETFRSTAQFVYCVVNFCQCKKKVSGIVKAANCQALITYYITYTFSCICYTINLHFICHGVVFSNVIPCMFKFLALFGNFSDQKDHIGISVHQTVILVWHHCFSECYYSGPGVSQIHQMLTAVMSKILQGKHAFNVFIMQAAIYWDLEQLMVFNCSIM